MNNEKMNQMIESAWKKYADSHFTPGNPNGKLLSEQLMSVRPMMHNRETFRAEILKNPDFASQWGLKIEEREVLEQVDQTNPILKGSTALYPRKLITMTYNNETIESYE
jgi:hypothetical protein